MACSILKTMGAIALALSLGCTPGTSLDDGNPTTEGPTSTTDASGSSDDPSTSGDPTTTAPTGDTTAATADSSDDGTTCGLPPVDDEVVDFLFIDGASQDYVAVDSSEQLWLAWIELGFPTEVEACVEWSIDPVDGVSIDADGLLTVGPAVPPGTIIPVTADLEEGRRIITANLEVYEPLDSPIVGYWSETLQLPCDGGPGFVPEPYIPELIFYDTGLFQVTWTPFESYVDYWGTFTHDTGTGALSLMVTGGNYVPPDVDGEGIATVVGGQLTLEDLWLGTAQDPVTPPACGHVFE